jgi:beta-lactamase class D
MHRVLAALLAVLLTAGSAPLAVSWADTIEERADLAKLFQQQGVAGTFVLHDVEAGRLIATDADRAQQAFVPGATFDIAIAVIALETGVVADEKGLKGIDFREAARGIGVPRMQEMLDKLGYGNRTLGDVIDRFWIDGPLEITAAEQAQFLSQLAQGKLPLAEQSQAQARELLRLERRGNTVLYGRTGLYAGTAPKLGWFVGWIERGNAVHAFALNIDVKSDKDASKRETIGRALLARLGVY